MRMHASSHYYLVALLFVSANNAFLKLVEAASVRLTKTCFSTGEDINVRFDNIDGEGIFIGLYPSSTVSSQTLPEITSPDLKEWILTCGSHNNCDSWPSRGLVQLSTNGLADGDYIIAVSGNRSGRTPQALTRKFEVGSCSLSSFFGVSPAQPPTVVFGPTIAASVPQVAPTPPAPAPTPIVQEISPQGASFVVGGGIQGTLDDARFQIENLIRGDGDLTGKFLRLMFHDCIGGCDGCVDMANPDNAGLEKPINVLQNIANNFRGRGLTRTDVWMLAGLVATETALPTNHRDILFDMQWVGRKTCEQRSDCGVDFNGNPTTCTPMRGPHVGQAHATMGTRSIQSFFEDEFNFSPQQVTALMGAHSVGRMSRENSGFEGRWDLSAAQLDGGYWIELIGQPPDYFLEDVINNDLPGIPNRRQWAGIVSANSRVTMLHTDIALVRFVDDMHNGNSNCEFNGQNSCTQDTPFMPHARRYTSDNRAWLFDFRDVLNLLSDHGHEKRIDCPSDRICTFGFQEPNTLSSGDVGQSIGFTPSNFGGEINGQATISLNKQCYNPGETIVVEYDNVAGENVWMAIMRSSDAPDFRNLPVGPDSHSDTIKEWTLSCGHRSCHAWNPRGGFQFPTNQLEQGSYKVVASGAGGSLQGQAAASFSLGGC